MKRIVVVGSAGAGKSTFSRELGRRLGLPVIHLDVHFWKPNWTETPNDEWDRKVVELASGDAWVMDGNYGRTLGLRLPRADTAILLDLPRTLCLWRVISRRIRHHGRRRADLGGDNIERIEWPFLRWIWNYPRDSRPRVLDHLARAADRLTVHRLRSRREVRKFLAGF